MTFESNKLTRNQLQQTERERNDVKQRNSTTTKGNQGKQEATNHNKQNTNGEDVDRDANRNRE
jgi:hypothetical protein